MSSPGSMDFRVELSEQAQRDIAAIYVWLRSQQAGDAGERWFSALRTAVSSLASLPTRCSWAPEHRDHPLKCVSCSTAADSMSIASCLPLRPTSCRCFTSDTVGEGPFARRERLQTPLRSPLRRRRAPSLTLRFVSTRRSACGVPITATMTNTTARTTRDRHPRST